MFVFEIEKPLSQLGLEAIPDSTKSEELAGRPRTSISHSPISKSLLVVLVVDEDTHPITRGYCCIGDTRCPSL